MLKLRRMWINNPSTLQPEHTLHGKRVLVIEENGNLVGYTSGIVRAYFVSGTVVSQKVHVSSLSNGWPATSHP